MDYYPEPGAKFGKIRKKTIFFFLSILEKIRRLFSNAVWYKIV
jgi:hypothetical protein